MIWCIGECLYDVVFKNGQPAWAVPGGSMLNVAVSAARSGGQVSLISEAGSDPVGEMLTGFLASNNITTDFIHRYKGNTTLALAFLSDSGEATYQFYHNSPLTAPAFQIPPFHSGDVLFFGSFYSVNPRNRVNILKLAGAAAQAGAWVCYDPNFRKPHLDSLGAALPLIAENIGLSDVVRGSDEDFWLIAGAADTGDAWNFVQRYGCSRFVCTRNSKGVDLFDEIHFRHFDVPQVEVVSTIGAGDAFNAGLATALHGRPKSKLSDGFWDEAIGRAIIFASEVCRSRDNFIGNHGNFSG